MQNKSINTVFLGIIIVLLAIGVWFLAKKNNEPKYVEQNQIAVVDTEKVVEEKEKVPEPIVKKPDPTITFLKSLLEDQPNSSISECSYEGKKYFSFHAGMGATDAPYIIYDANGKEYVSSLAPMVPNATVSSVYASMSATCTKVIYAWPWGAANPSVDIYNLK